jgi:hypothetical protein
MVDSVEVMRFDSQVYVSSVVKSKCGALVLRLAELAPGEILRRSGVHMRGAGLG